MRAVVLDRYGPPGEVLRVDRVERPAPGTGEVLVRVRAVSVNSWDVDLAVGAMLVRLNAPRRPKHRIIGSDVAGEVVAVGDGTSTFTIGDQVFGELTVCGWGGFAEYVVATEHALVRRPAGVDELTAAALPQAASMAFQALGDLDALAGRRVLLVGAGGGVGTFALQLAMRAGAHVTVVDRKGKLEPLRELGADAVIEARPRSARGSSGSALDAASARFDRLLDIVGALPAGRARQLLAPNGEAVAVGGRPRRILGVAVAGARGADREGRRVRLLAAVPNRDLPVLADLVAEGALLAVIDGPHPLEAVPATVARLAAGEVFGKAVIAID